MTPETDHGPDNASGDPSEVFSALLKLDRLHYDVDVPSLGKAHRVWPTLNKSAADYSESLRQLITVGLALFTVPLAKILAGGSTPKRLLLNP